MSKQVTESSSTDVLLPILQQGYILKDNEEQISNLLSVINLNEKHILCQVLDAFTTNRKELDIGIFINIASNILEKIENPLSPDVFSYLSKNVSLRETDFIENIIRKTDPIQQDDSEETILMKVASIKEQNLIPVIFEKKEAYESIDFKNTSNKTALDILVSSYINGNDEEKYCSMESIILLLAHGAKIDQSMLDSSPEKLKTLFNATLLANYIISGNEASQEIAGTLFKEKAEIINDYLYCCVTSNVSEFISSRIYSIITISKKSKDETMSIWEKYYEIFPEDTPRQKHALSDDSRDDAGEDLVGKIPKLSLEEDINC